MLMHPERHTAGRNVMSELLDELTQFVEAYHPEVILNIILNSVHCASCIPAVDKVVIAGRGVSKLGRRDSCAYVTVH